MIAWPANLPQCPHHQYELTPISGVSSADDQQSPFRARTYPEFVGVFNFQALTVDQQNALRVFYEMTLNQVAPFSAPWLPYAGLSHHFCRFAADRDAIQWQGRRGKRADATISVIVIAGVPVDPENGSILYGED